MNWLTALGLASVGFAAGWTLRDAAGVLGAEIIEHLHAAIDHDDAQVVDLDDHRTRRTTIP